MGSVIVARAQKQNTLWRESARACRIRRDHGGLGLGSKRGSGSLSLAASELKG